MNNKLLEEETKHYYTKSIQKKRPPYWGRKSKKLQDLSQTLMPTKLA
jgi:hypothetical protein